MKPSHRLAIRFERSCRLLDFLIRAANVILLVFGFGGGVFMPARAAQPPAPLIISSNRYLFIVDTSLSMKPRAPGALQRIETLLLSDINGNLRRGDTLGLWTFNEKLYAGQFPMQVWSPEQKQTIAKRFIAFMRNQPIEKKPKVAQALAQMSEVVKNSDNLTVLLFSAGDEKLRGTPFDDDINEVYKSQGRSMQKAGMPFVTVLRAQGGKIFAYSVNFGPWPIDIPAFPNSLASVQIPEASPAVTNLPPLVVSATTNKTASVTPQEKVVSAAEVNKDKPAVTESVAPNPAPVSLASGDADKAGDVPAAKSEPPSVATPPAVSKPVATFAVIETPKLEVAKLKPSEPAPPPLTVATPAESKPVVASAEPAVVGDVAKPTPLSGPAKADDQTLANLEDPTPPIQTAAAVPPSSSFSSVGLLIAAVTLLAVALGLVVLFIRRARNLSQPSLITRSLDRREK